MDNPDHLPGASLDDISGKSCTDFQVISAAHPDEITLIANSPNGDLIADNEVLGAVAATYVDALHIDHTLDLLTSSIDLFDVPTWDVDLSS